MLTPVDFKYNYFALLDESYQITGIDSYENYGYDYGYVTKEDSFTEEQWNNLVKVASIIKANENRFDMQEWHKKTNCGVVHCIAGWAQSLAENDTNYVSPDGYAFSYPDPVVVAEKMLSEYVYPFFWITTSELTKESGQHEGLAEQLVMKYFIDPILEEARKESYELSSEITQFIELAQKEAVTV